MIAISNDDARRLVKSIEALLRLWKPQSVREKNTVRNLRIVQARISRIMQKQQKQKQDD